MASVNELRQKVQALEEQLRKLRLTDKAAVAVTLEDYDRRIARLEKVVADTVKKVKRDVAELQADQQRFFSDLNAAWEKVRAAVKQAEELVAVAKDMSAKVEEKQRLHRQDIERLLSDLGVVHEIKDTVEELKKKLER